MKVVPIQPRLRYRKQALRWLPLLCVPLLLFSELTPAGARVASENYQAERSAYDLCNQSNALLASGSYAQARDLLVKAAAYDPTSYSASVHVELAQCYKGLKDYQQAIAEAQLALKFDPHCGDAMYALAVTYYAQQQFDDATQCLQKFVQMSTDEEYKAKARKLIAEIAAYKNLKSASTLIEAQRYSDAKRVLEKAAMSDPSPFSASVHGNLAYVLERTGNPERAIEEGQKTLKLDSNDKATVYTVGIAYQDIGRFDDAISWLKRYTLMETDDEARTKANNFIQELADDRSKQDDSANSKPDYLDQLRANSSVEMWPSEELPIKVYISPSTGVYGYRPVFKTFVIRSLDTWCTASGKKLNYKLVDDPNKAAIKVSWTRDELSMHENNRTRQKAGLTTPMLDANQKILNEDVRIRTVHGFDPKKLITDGECASTCMHEVGHAMGLGHSTCCSDIMYFGSSSKQSGFPTKRDKATIARLYQDYPQVKFTPSSVSPPPGAPIQYLPPPAFLPPIPPDTKKLVPPLFVPPPLKKELQPPLFIPPPANQAASTTKTKQLNVPLFVPPPLPQRKSRDQSDPRLFIPPPK
jgi:tetratricopeptide (TPR) repeat protein